MAGAAQPARAQTGDWWKGDHDVLLGYGCTTLWLEVVDHRFHCPAGWRVHEGIDLDTPIGTPVYAGYSGIVTEVGGPERHDYGRHYIKVWLDEGHDVLLGHLSRSLVAVGDHLDAGQLIGYSGNLGECNWPNLHLEVRPHRGTTYASVDPVPFIHLTPEAVERGQMAATTGRLEALARFEYGDSDADHDPAGMVPLAGPPPQPDLTRRPVAVWAPSPELSGALAGLIAGAAGAILVALVRAPLPGRRGQQPRRPAERR